MISMFRRLGRSVGEDAGVSPERTAVAPRNEAAARLPSVAPAPPPVDTGPFDRLLQQWVAFGSVHQRVLKAVNTEIAGTNRDVEQATGSLSEAFQTLATRAQAQSRRVESITTLAGSVSAGEETIPLGDVAALFDRILGGVVGKIEFLSAQAAPAKQALDDAGATLERIEECIDHVHDLTQQTNMLALNARIEAARLGHAGKAFDVVANEMLELAKSTKELSETLRAQFAAIGTTLGKSHETLRQIASVDISSESAAKERLSQLIAALVRRSGEIGSVMEAAGTDADEISRRVAQIITTTQFQDRMSQRLGQVTDTLTVLGDAVSDLQSSSRRLEPDLSLEISEDDLAWLRHLAARYKLSDMRADFVDRAIHGRDTISASRRTSATGNNATGSIELF